MFERVQNNDKDDTIIMKSVIFTLKLLLLSHLLRRKKYIKTLKQDITYNILYIYCTYYILYSRIE